MKNYDISAKNSAMSQEATPRGNGGSLVAVKKLLTIMERLTGENPVPENELQALKAEINRLKNEQGKSCTNNKQDRNLSSEAGLLETQRGDALPANGNAQPVKAPEILLHPEMPLAEAIRAILRGGLVHFLRNAVCLAQGDHPEAVHQARVALRRLRSAFTLFSGVLDESALPLREELRWAAGTLGDARNLDVFLDEIAGPVIAALPDHCGLQALAAEVAGRRDRAYVSAGEALRSPRLIALCVNLAAWIEGESRLSEATLLPVKTFAAAILTRRRRKAGKAGRHFRRLEPKARHALRIDLKKLRYASEFFRSLWPGKAAREAALVVSSLQDELGHINDVAVARLLLAGLSAEAPFKNRNNDLTEHAFAAGLIIGWHEREAAERLAAAGKTWKAFLKTSHYWRE
ncbi:CHAD domain-containing protein [Candidatus Methylospira mobilis]|nr:CHAD domain-containing protein [Candidatus Methylospira mobilis]WNV05627.1 CHAD domain-containing protein [Candidatus Methylospira mobilis]